MKVKEWKPKTLQLIVAIISLISTPFALNILLYCPADTIAGVDVSYSQLLNSSHQEPPSLTAKCNLDCSCTTQLYDPVCDETVGVTYFSPCYAGCRVVRDIHGNVMRYSDCTCTPSGTVVPGECGQPCPKSLIGAMGLETLELIFKLSFSVSVAYNYNRVVNALDRTFSQGLKTGIVNLLGFIPAPIIFGGIMDHYCTIWRENEDGTTGNCWTYDVEHLAKCLVVVRCVVLLVGTLFRFLAYWFWDDSPVEDQEHDRLVEVAENETDKQMDEHE